MNIGLTGGIACGKSTVADMLVERGAILIDADRIAREVVEPGTELLGRVADTFGPDILHPDGSLNRARLGERIFADAELRKRLEGLLHPEIRATMRRRMQEAEASHPERLVVVDVPLLYESGQQAMYEGVLVVAVTPDKQLERLMVRNGLTREQAVQRIAAQMPIERKRELADYVIDNSGDREETARQVDVFLQSKGLL